MQRELELKVELSASAVERLAGELPQMDLSIGPASTMKLRTIYFDTPAHGLHEAGLSLRLRNQNGSWLQTVKSDQHVAAGLSNPVELEVLLTTDQPDLGKIADKKIKRSVEKALKGASLRPVFETFVERTTRKIKARESEVELALDAGEVRTPEARAELNEAELELKAGSAEGLLLAAESMLAGHELKLGTRSKAERGYRLALEKRDSCPEPEKSRPVRIRRKDDSATAFAAILASASRQILINRVAVLESDDPEATHQLRIGLRRLRSALQALRPFVISPSLKSFECRVRELAHAVGVLRDADVLISTIAAPIEAKAPDKNGFVELTAALLRHRRATREEVRAALRGPAWTRLQLYLALWPRTLQENDKLAGPIAKVARKALRKAWRKCAKLAAAIDELSGEERHEMRKALKKLRYQTEFFAPLFAEKKTEAFVRQLKALQDVFGYVNDVRMAPRLMEIQRHHGQTSIAAARTVGYILGQHEMEARHVWRQAAPTWRGLERASRFWT
jgi:inorganic triphosphatase YgiF